MLHFGTLDKHIPKEEIDKVQLAHPEVQIFGYNADHGFSCEARPATTPRLRSWRENGRWSSSKKHLAG